MSSLVCNQRITDRQKAGNHNVQWMNNNRRIWKKWYRWWINKQECWNSYYEHATYVQEGREKYEHKKRNGRQVKDPDQTSGNEKEIHGGKNTLGEINHRLNTA